MMDIAAISAALSEGRTSAERLVADAFARIRACAPYNAALELFEADAFASAGASDALLRAGTPRSPLEGVPFAVKANIAVKGHAMSCGSRVLENYASPYAATVVERLTRAGAIAVCSANMDEFAMGSTGENSAFGATLNPYDQGRVAGGSSSGSAALVALKCVPFALGSDTGGSVRLPAAYCGVCGMKPTYGALSRYGLAAYASSLDQIGVIARSPADILTVLRIAAGQDPMDATSLDVSLLSSRPIRRLAPVQNMIGCCAVSVKHAIQAFLSRASKRVCVSDGIEMTGFEAVAPAYYVLACAEASENLARYDGVRYGVRGGDAFGAEVKKRVAMGEFFLSRDQCATYYQRARAVRNALCTWFDEAFSAADCLIMPVSAQTAPLLDRKHENAACCFKADMMTAAANLAGLPAISIPCGTDESGLPIGVQLIAPKCRDEALLSFASSLLKGENADA